VLCSECRRQKQTNTQIVDLENTCNDEEGRGGGVERESFFSVVLFCVG
jgi:hypothetical protein